MKKRNNVLVPSGKAGREMASASITVERGVVGFGLDYACAHIILVEISSVNLLPIQADFVTERDSRVVLKPTQNRVDVEC